jgi:thioredoxin 1
VDYNEFQLTIIVNLIYMKKFYILIFLIFAFSANSMEKKTTFDKKLFDAAQLDGKVVVVSSWTKYCSSCASQMKVLDKAKNEFDNIEFFSFNIKNKEITKLFDVQYQTTLLIFKDNKEVYRSIGETSKDLIYEAIQSSI